MSGELYHYTIINSNVVYERFISPSIPSILWPNHSYSTPLQYNPQKKEFSIQINKQRHGEYIYYERFINLIKFEFKLIKNNGFSLMFEKFNNQIVLTPEARTYTQHYASIYQNIHTASDLMTFLNWYATEEITKQLDLLLKQLLEQAEVESIVHKILATPSKLTLKLENDKLLIELPPQKDES